jgi:Flp pilus assembly pilin Flp
MHVLKDESGQGLAEYGWVIVLVAIVIMAILVVLGATIFGLWEKAWEALKDVFLSDAARPILNLLACQWDEFLCS